MKVLHLISGGDSGGAKTHVFALMKALKKQIDAKIICLMDGQFLREIKELGVDAELVEQKSRFDFSAGKKLVKIIKDGGYDVLHCHGARANFVAWQIKKKINSVVITTVHSDYRLDFDGIYKKIFYTGLNMLALRKADYYIGVSENFKDMLIDRGFNPNDIYSVYNCIDFSEEPQYVSRDEFAKRIGIKDYEDKILIGIIGRHEYVKGHDIFVRAAKVICEKYDNVRFVVAGGEEGLEPIRALAEECGISDKIIFTGFVRDIYSFINFVDINTLSSRSESFPYVLLEGARMKKPTVSSNVGGISDLICHGETGLLFESEDVEGFATQLEILCKDKELRTRLGENLYKYASENYSDTNLAQNHIDIYNDIIKRSRDKDKYDVVISGYYGFRNSGDDALLYAILNDLREKRPNIRATVLSAHPGETKRLYRVNSVYRFNMPAASKAIKCAKMLISGGGSLIQDETSSLSLYYYLHIMKTAKRFGKKLYVYANGLGPVKDKNIKCAGEVLRLADKITLRDAASVKELERMGINSDAAKVTADPALNLCGADRKQIRKIFETEGIPEGRYIGVSIRQWHKNDRNFEEKLAASLDMISNKYGLIPVFIPMKLGDDVRISRSVCNIMNEKGYVLSNAYSVDETIGITACMDMILGMRLHTLIYAAAAGVPIVGIVYDPKISAFLSYLGQNFSVDVERFDEAEMIKLIEKIINDKDLLRDTIAAKTATLKEKAKQNAEFAIEMLE